MINKRTLLGCGIGRLRLPIIVLAFLTVFTACKDQEPEKEKMSRRDVALGETYVDTMTLHLSSFRSQIVCNGRLRAMTTSELTFPKPGYIKEIHVREGQYVQRGALIASIDKRDCERQVERATHEMERARVAFVDKLIGLGYDASMKDVPEEIRKHAEVTSGYYTAKYELQSAKTALAECDLYAPFSGRVANVDARVHQMSEKVCTLVDDSQFDVEFSVLEAELSEIRNGQTVHVTPFINDSLVCKGTIREINPMVDEKGLVKVGARINGRKGDLMDGQNMRIVVEKQMERMFVVPKDAVVERDGQHVVFLLRDGRAIWTYVDVLQSNINSYAIRGSRRKETQINEGDVVITSGNLNLADGTEVKIR